MPYCTKEDVAGEFKNIVFSATSAVTESEVSEFTVQESNFIDSMIASRYVVPVTGTNSLSVLKKIAIALSADRVRNILLTKTGASDKDQDSTGIIQASRARKDLMMIQEGTLRLTDATALNQNVGFDTGCKSDPVFDTSKDQW